MKFLFFTDTIPAEIITDVVEFNCVFQPCTTPFQFGVIVPASYDEYTTLVKSGNVASKHVNGWRVRSKRQILKLSGDLVQTSKNCDAEHERTFNSSAADLDKRWLETGRSCG